MSNQQNQKNVKFITTRAPSVGEEGYIKYRVSLVEKDEDLFKPISEIIPQYDNTYKSRDLFYRAAYKRMLKHLGFVEDKHKKHKYKQYLDFLQEMCRDINGRKRTKKRTEMIKKIQKAYAALYKVAGQIKKLTKDYKFLTDFLKENKICKMSKKKRKYLRELYHLHGRKNSKIVLFKPNTVKQQETMIQENNFAIPFPEQSQESKNMFGAEPGNTIFPNNNIIQNNIFNDKSDEMSYNEYSEGNLDELSEVGEQFINNGKITFNLGINNCELLKP